MLDFPKFLSTIAIFAPLSKASLANLLPSIFLPLSAKKTVLFLICFEFIEAKLIFFFLIIFLFIKFSLIIFNFKLSHRFLFLELIYLIIHSLSEKKLLNLYS